MPGPGSELGRASWKTCLRVTLHRRGARPRLRPGRGPKMEDRGLHFRMPLQVVLPRLQTSSAEDTTCQAGRGSTRNHSRELPLHC